MKAVLSVLFSLIIATVIHAQVDQNSQLYLLLEKQDSAFFERGFNQCDLEYLKNTVSEDLKFYHDQSGFQNKDIFLENTRKYICANREKKPIRILEKGSLVVYPLYDDGVLYGAIQSGIHHFYIREAGKEDLQTATSKFTHVWVLEDGVWKLSEVLSYDH